MRDWAPAHVGVAANETVGLMAKQSLAQENADVIVQLEEWKGNACKQWQEQWDACRTGQHLYRIQAFMKPSRVVPDIRR